MNCTLDEFVDFLFEFRANGWAGNAPEQTPSLPGMKEPGKYTKGSLEALDSYSGFYFAPGREIVWENGIPLWMMLYSGGMLPDYRKCQDFAKLTYAFLRKALLNPPRNAPYRGPNRFIDGDFKDFEYACTWNNNIDNPNGFLGREIICYKDKPVFLQDFIGGFIVHKNPSNIQR